MPDLEDPQDEWEMEKVRDKRRIKGVIHYLVKWAGWPSEYNSYEPASRLANAPRAVADFERKFKRTRMEAKAVGKADNYDNEAADPEDVSAPRKRARRSRT